MLIYWIFVAVLRIVLQTLLLLEIFYYNILESSSYKLLYTLLEVLDYGKPQLLSLHHVFQSDSVVSLFSSGSHFKSFADFKLVQATEASGSKQLYPTAERSVILELNLEKFLSLSYTLKRKYLSRDKKLLNATAFLFSPWTLWTE